jgi:hypothetical protein
MMFMLAYIFWAYALIIFAIAARWGGRDEWLGMLIMLAALLATKLVTRRLDVRYNDVEQLVLLVDLFMVLSLAALAFRTDRFWPLWAIFFHLASIYTHLGMYWTQRALPFSYHTMIAAWGYLTIASLGIGVWEQRQRSHLRARN